MTMTWTKESPTSPTYSPAMLNLIAGGGAGVVETTLTYPLDLARTRIQMTKAGTAASPTPLLALLRGIVRTEGGVLRLYRGLLPPLVSEVPRRALKFTTNDAYTRLLLQLQDGGPGALN